MFRLFRSLTDNKQPQQTVHPKFVKLICWDQWYRMKGNTMAEFVLACEKNIDPGFMIKKEVVIEPTAYAALGMHDNTHHIALSPNLSFKITNQEALTIHNQILNILRDPYVVMSLLQDLEQELAKRMKSEGVRCSSKDQPQYVIAGYAYYLPGPPPAAYQTKKKNKLLDRLLLEREMSHGINREGYAAKFVGIVDVADGNAFVADGHLFTEDKQISRILVHGPHTHRLVFDALCTAIKTKRLILRAGEQVLTPKQLLELMASASMRDPTGRVRKIATMWVMLMDNLIEEMDCKYNQAQYQFKCRSPNALNSLLLCFGADLGVPHLQQCLLDSHWKAAFKMVKRVQDAMSDEVRERIPVGRVYTYCMEYMERVSNNSAHYDERVPYALSRDEARANAKYEAVGKELASGIVRVRRGSLG